ncbi:MAG: polyhydroxyalkanoic acid system family protein [Deltaproteobacteria bacterium]|nr:polyhydroxyalkanoic acid system family protein [Kofleriaceae bacterium]
MEIDYKHGLPDADARARLEVLGEYLHNRHGIRVTWTDNSARFHGKYMVVKIDGEMRLEPGIVRFRGEDPGFLWRKKATDYIHGKLKSYLDPKSTLADLPRGK